MVTSSKKGVSELLVVHYHMKYSNWKLLLWWSWTLHRWMTGMVFYTNLLNDMSFCREAWQTQPKMCVLWSNDWALLRHSGRAVLIKVVCRCFWKFLLILMSLVCQVVNVIIPNRHEVHTNTCMVGLCIQEHS